MYLIIENNSNWADNTKLKIQHLGVLITGNLKNKFNCICIFTTESDNK